MPAEATTAPNPPFGSDHRPKLHEYQIRAVEFLRSHPRGALFLDMGLGKTAIAATALRPENLPVLVIAPKRVAEHTWPEELDLWRPDLSYRVATGGPEKRASAIASEADVVTISRDSIKSLPTRHRFKTIIIDELSSFKNRQSRRWSIARRVTKDVPYVWGLTGTPAPNSLLDLWPQMFLIDRGKTLGASITQFRHRWFMEGARLPSGVILEWILRPGADRAIYDLLKPSVLSMLGETHLDLPPVTYNRLPAKLPPKVLGQIKEFKEDLVLAVDTLGVFSAENAAVLTGKMRQMSSGFLYHDQSKEYSVIHEVKMDLVNEIIEGTGGSPVLVFYQFKAEEDLMRKRFPTSRSIKEPGVIDEWNAGRVPILLAHPESAGHGLNLQHGGHTIVWLSLPWSSEQWEQGNARLARQGQKNPVVIHTLESPGTVDRHVRRVLTDKVNAQQALMDYLEEEE